MNQQGETYLQELAEGAEPQDLLEAADKEVASLRAEVTRLREALEAIALEDPTIQDEIHACFWCGVFVGHDHDASCAWKKGRAALAGLEARTP